jgi:hypothetical protein
LGSYEKKKKKRKRKRKRKRRRRRRRKRRRIWGFEEKNNEGQKRRQNEGR